MIVSIKTKRVLTYIFLANLIILGIAVILGIVFGEYIFEIMPWIDAAMPVLFSLFIIDVVIGFGLLSVYLFEMNTKSHNTINSQTKYE